ncbi:MAG: alpha/beta hydrolase, partial [Bacteroidetes bacterium]
MQKRIIFSEEAEHYTENFGNPSDPAILLIMGAMASGAWWPGELCRMLALRGRFVIRYDHRDTGGSTSYKPGTLKYNTEDLADDAMRILNGYGIEVAHLVGMSLGGYLAQLLALKYTEHILSLTLISSERLASADPTMPGISPLVLEYHSRATGLDWTDHTAIFEYQIGAWKLLAGSAHPFDRDLIRVMVEEDMERTPDLLTPFNHAMLQDASVWSDRLDEIKVPVLIIHGTEDIVLPFVHAEALHRDLPGSRLVALHGTGHDLPRADWPEIVDEIEQHTAV